MNTILQLHSKVVTSVILITSIVGLLISIYDPLPEYYGTAVSVAIWVFSLWVLKRIRNFYIAGKETTTIEKKFDFVAFKVSVAVFVELWYMFVLQGGERMKYRLLKDLYDCFYTPPELQAQKQEIDECHQALSEVLGKTERRLVLQIIDAKDRIAEDTSIDSFIAGFELAWKLSAELNHYENEHSVSCRTAMGLGARFASKEAEK